MTLRQSQDLITIREFAKLCRTTPRTLRFYEQKGLFTPDSIDQFTKYRYYNPQRSRDFFRIKLLQDFSIPLADIKAVLSLDTQEDIMQTKMQEVRKQIEEKEKEYEFLKQIRHFLFADEDISHLFQEEVIGPYVLLAKHLIQGRYDKINEEITEMVSLAKKETIPLEGSQIAFYLAENIYKPVDHSLELALVLDGDKIPNISLPPNYTFKVFPKTKIIYYLYRGPYAYITLLYQKIQQSTIPGIDKNTKSMDFYLPIDKNMSEYEKATKIAFIL